MGVGLNDNNAILNSVDVVVEVGVELGNIKNKLYFKNVQTIWICRLRM